MPDRPLSAAAPAARERSPAALAAAALAALAVAIGIGRFAFTPLLPLMQEDAGVSVADGGWLAAANYAGYLAGALSAVALPLRAGGAVRLGLVAIGLLTLGMGLAQEFAAWLALRALAGVASAWVLVFVTAWALEQLASLRRPEFAGAVFAGVGAGIAAAGVLCLALMHAGTGSAQSWIVFGLLSLAVTAAIWPAFGGGEARAPLAASRERDSARANGESARLVLCYGVFGFGYIIPATFLPLMAKQAVHDPSVFGWSWPVFGVAAALSTLAAAAWARRLGDRRLWILGHFVMALGVALPVLVPGIAAIMVAALAVGGTFMVITMAGIQEARRVAGARARGLIAAMTSAFAAGQIAGPLLVSALAGTERGFSIALLAASALLALSTLALWTRRPT